MTILMMITTVIIGTTRVTLRSTALLKKLTSAKLDRNSYAFIEAKGSHRSGPTVPIPS